MVLDSRTNPKGSGQSLKTAFGTSHDIPVELLLSSDPKEIRALAEDHRISPQAHIRILEKLLATTRAELTAAHNRIQNLGGELASASEQLARANEAAAAAEIAKNMDALTGLQNRGAFDRELNSILQQQKPNHGANDNTKNVCIVFIDIDGLKQTNDCYGHAAGDKLLLSVTSLLKQSLRTNDTIFRVGGDEVIIMMEGDAQKIQEKMLKIQSELETKKIRVDVCAKWKDIPVWGFSFGIHKVDTDLSAEQNYHLADAEMYHNKEGRKVDQAAIRQTRLAEMQEDKQRIRVFDGCVKSNTSIANDSVALPPAP